MGVGFFSKNTNKIFRITLIVFFTIGMNLAMGVLMKLPMLKTPLIITPIVVLILGIVGFLLFKSIIKNDAVVLGASHWAQTNDWLFLLWRIVLLGGIFMVWPYFMRKKTRNQFIEPAVLSRLI